MCVVLHVNVAANLLDDDNNNDDDDDAAVDDEAKCILNLASFIITMNDYTDNTGNE